MAFASLCSVLPGLDKDEDFWWRTTSPILNQMLVGAGYSHHQQYLALKFYYCYIAPYLGKRPDAHGNQPSWESYMTDDFSPLEFSWQWATTRETTSATIRFSIEVIGQSAGTPADPYNRKRTLELVHQLKSVLPMVDWSHFDQLYDTIFSGQQNHVGVGQSVRGTESGQASVFLAFELHGSEVAVKAYFMPNNSDDNEGEQTAASKMLWAIKGLDQAPSNSPALRQLLRYMQNKVHGRKLRFLFLAVDCVPQSRVKIYARSSSTSFETVLSIMSLSTAHPGREKALADLRELWGLVLDLGEQFCSQKELPEVQHHTAGILFHFDVQQGNEAPEPKVYIPVKHYGRDDLHTVQALSMFLERRGSARFAKRFIHTLEQISSYRSLESGRGLQTYISCAIKGGELMLTSYLSPEIYHKGRF